MDYTFAFHNSRDAVPVAWALVILLGGFAGLVILAVKVLIYCKIFAKAGYCWALGLLMLVPLVNLIMPFVLAFADWPIQKRLRQLKQQGTPEG